MPYSHSVPFQQHDHEQDSMNASPGHEGTISQHRRLFMQYHRPSLSTPSDLQNFAVPALSLLLLLFLIPIATLTPMTTAISIANVPKMKPFVFRRCGIAIPGPACPRITIRTRSMYGGKGSSMSCGLYSGGGVFVRDCGTGTRSSEGLS